MRRNGERPSHRPDNPVREIDGAARAILYRDASVGKNRERELQRLYGDEELIRYRVFLVRNIEHDHVAAGILEVVHCYGGVCGCTVTKVPMEPREINTIFLLIICARLEFRIRSYDDRAVAPPV